MPRKPSGKPKRNVWTDPPAYGRYVGERGSTASWKRAFSDASTHDGAVLIVSDDSPWGILGLAPDVDLRTAKSQYRKLLLENHPDHGGDSEKCRRIIAAWTLVEESFR